MKKLYTCLFLLAQSVYGFAQTTSTFEALTLDASGYWIGADGSGGFTNGDAYFQNIFSSQYGPYWEGGFAYSNQTDATTAGPDNQYSVYTGSGVGHSEKFALGKSRAVIELNNVAKTKEVTGFYLANTTYTALSMLNGDAYAKKFGGATGNDPDFFQLAITGYRNNAVISDTVKFKLADFTFADNSKDYILNTWRWIDLRPLGVVDSLIFILSSSDNDPIFGMNTPNYFAIDHFNEPLYDLAVVNGGTDAISKESSLFKSWGSICTVTRGYLDIANPSLGYASFGTDVNGTLKADGSLVSLGDNGIAIIEFDKPIKNDVGPDFAVFENAFNIGTNQFLELAFVEVSSDGINYVRFPSISKTNATTQLGNSAQMDASLIYNLAGKYVANYGTPFDLEQLKNHAQLDVNNITHVKIIDVIGTIDLQLSTKDSLGNPINDPYATPFASCGFDLDAVGVINQNELATSINASQKTIFEIYPNPSSNQFNISLIDVSFVGQSLYVYDVNGILVKNEIVTEINILDASTWDNGIYYIRVGNTAQKIIKID